MIIIEKNYHYIEIIAFSNFSQRIDNFIKIGIILINRGISTVGSALRWQRRGHRFEPGMLHFKRTANHSAVLFILY